MKSSADAIDATAAKWLARREHPEWTTEDDTALHRWVAESTAHRVAYLRLTAAWSRGDRLAALSNSHEEVPEGCKPSWPADRPWAKAAAALLVLAIPASFIPYLITPAAIETSIGGTQAVTLSDGSEVKLNTATRVVPRLTQSVRAIALDRGEAYFAVQKDASREFVVRVGKYDVVAIGTAFSVRREGDEVRVVVSEGVVQLRDKRNAATEVTRLSAGTIAETGGQTPKLVRMAQPAISAELQWRSGLLAFADKPLGEVIGEFNRYRVKPIKVDRAIADLKVSGVFRTDNASGFVALLAQNRGVGVTQRGDEIDLVARLQ